MNRYMVQFRDVENDDYSNAHKIEKVEADSFVITANGDLKFQMKAGGCVEAYADTMWVRVRMMEEGETVPKEKQSNPEEAAGTSEGEVTETESDFDGEHEDDEGFMEEESDAEENEGKIGTL
jgi:hypothetical protein